jgi:hypothetical protein
VKGMKTIIFAIGIGCLAAPALAAVAR